MDTREIQRRLNDNGFPVGPIDGDLGPRTQLAVRRFQLAYCGPGGWLGVDGNAGPRTQEALTFLPKISTHFNALEFACKHCGQAYVHRALLSALERLRERLGRGIVIMSGYRCPTHNANVGGKPNSMHPHGGGCDLATAVSLDMARSINRFSGIGRRGNLASHVDVRGVDGVPNFTPGRTPTNPEIWKY